MRRRAKKEAREPPEQTEWHDLVRLDAMQDFAAWLSEPRQGWSIDACRGRAAAGASVWAVHRRRLGRAQGSDSLPKGGHGALVCVCV
ncbi:hypothetical protein [Selenomonas sputigena]|uniref:hypothetical protein n=1 Tax=Selenomonas sputigena TaxID=69823 RepID=UPI0022343DA3|nr:hypothetical protein [Selenomonas sputigena]UZE45983.1 hypothetical protein OL236_03375 [Selenomonas sputigena]